MSEATTEKKVESEVEIGAEELQQISKQVGEQITPAIEKSVAEASEKAADAVLSKYLAKIEDASKKQTTDKSDAEKAAKKTTEEVDTKFKDIAAESAEMRLFKAARALANGDQLTLQRYNQYTLETREKAGYANETTAADGQVLLPPLELDTNIYENLPKYGVAFQYADVRQTDRTQVKVMSLDSGLEFYATAEAGVKTSGKLTFSAITTDLQKYAVIVPSTDELTDDAAIDFWALVTKELSRAYAKKADEVVFTDTTYGITNKTGVITEPVSGAGTTINWDDLLSAEGKVEDGLDTSGFRWFMRKETWFRLAQKRADAVSAADGAGAYLFQPNPNQPTTPWGTPVTFTRVLPKSSEVGSNDAFAVYGDLSNYILYNKRGMAMTVLREATIVDANSSNFNLATQDGTAMRAVIRMLGVCPKGNAGKFVILGTGTVS